jgi:uncharacterized glyoxalase superfamily protein PhnB
MTTKRTSEPWMPADDYGRGLPRFTVNLLVREIARSLPFYRDVLGATVDFADVDFAALRIAGVQFMLHADHTYDQHPLHERLARTTERGTGAELRVLGLDPDEIEGRAQSVGAQVLQHTADKPHGWRDVIVTDPDGYLWAVGKPI